MVNFARQHSTLDQPNHARHGPHRPHRRKIRSRSWPAGLHHDCRRLDDRVGHFHRFGGYFAAGRFSRLAPARVALHRRAHPHRRSELRRAGRHDAASGRTIRLSARSLQPALGFSLRLDAVPGDPDRNDRGGRGRLRPVSGRPAAVGFADRLDHCRRSISRPVMP